MRATKKLYAMALLLALSEAAGAQTVTRIIDSSGDAANVLTSPRGIAVETTVEGSANVYVTGFFSNNAFKITPDGTITEIIDETGDGTNSLNGPEDIAVDAAGNVYVVASNSDNGFKIEPDGTITEIIDSTADGINSLGRPTGVALDASANVYVTGFNSDNGFKITPDGTITGIIDGRRANLDGPGDIAVDASGNVYVAGRSSDNAFKITPAGVITEIINASGDGTNNLNLVEGIAVGPFGNVYVVGQDSDNGFKITPGGTITEIFDRSGDGTNSLRGPTGIAVDAAGNIYVATLFSDNAFRITPDGTITEIIDRTGDHFQRLDSPRDIAAEGSGTVYLAGSFSDNAFRVTAQGKALSEIAGLIVPGFEVAVDDPTGPTTFFAVRNTTNQEVDSQVDYYAAASTDPLRTDTFSLSEQATKPLDVRTNLSDLVIKDGMATGFIVVTEVGSTTAPRLEGDYFRVDTGNSFASGDRMVRPEDFCLKQEIRFVDFGSGFQLRILLNRPRGDELPSFSYTAYDQAGTVAVDGDFETSNYLSVLDVGELGGKSSGTVVFDFSSSGGGWVSAKYSAFGKFSVELRSACRDE